MSAMDSQLLNLIDPELTWKTVTKGYRSSARRRAACRNFPVIAYEGARKHVDTTLASDTEKNGVDILGRHFNDKLEHVPIKKRRFRVSSPSISQSPRSLKNVIESFSSQKRQRKGRDAQGTSKPGISFCNEDFSGIEILAAVACDNGIADGFYSKNTQNGKGLTDQESISSSKTAIPKVEGDAHGEANDALPQTNSDVVNDAPDAAASSRVHWDLNVSMDAWAAPLDHPAPDEPKPSVDEIDSPDLARKISSCSKFVEKESQNQSESQSVVPSEENDENVLSSTRQAQDEQCIEKGEDCRDAAGNRETPLELANEMEESAKSMTTALDGQLARVSSPAHDGSEELLQKSCVDSSTSHSEGNLAKIIAEDGDNCESYIYETDKISAICDEVSEYDSQFEDGEVRESQARQCWTEMEDKMLERSSNRVSRGFPKGGDIKSSKVRTSCSHSRASNKESLPLSRTRSENDDGCDKFLLPRGRSPIGSSMGFWNTERCSSPRPVRPKVYQDNRIYKDRVVRRTPVERDEGYHSQRRSLGRSEFHHRSVPDNVEGFDRHRAIIRDDRRKVFPMPSKSRSRSPFYDQKERNEFKFRSRLERERMPFPKRVYVEDPSPPHNSRCYDDRKYGHRLARMRKFPEEDCGEYDDDYHRRMKTRQHDDDHKRFRYDVKMDWRMGSDAPYPPTRRVESEYAWRLNSYRASPYGMKVRGLSYGEEEARRCRSRYEMVRHEYESGDRMDDCHVVSRKLRERRRYSDVG